MVFPLRQFNEWKAFWLVTSATARGHWLTSNYWAGSGLGDMGLLEDSGPP